MQHKAMICFDLIVFLLKNLNVFNFSAAAKFLRRNYAFFVKPTRFLLNQEKRKHWQIFELNFLLYHTNIDIL